MSFTLAERIVSRVLYTIEQHTGGQPWP